MPLRSEKFTDKALILATLVNHAKVLGMGVFDPRRDRVMTPADAKELIVLRLEKDERLAFELKEKMYFKRGQLYFDYVWGRVIKCDIGPWPIDSRLYDRDNGRGAFDKAMEAIE